MSDKRVSEMTDDEIRAMAGASGPAAATLAGIAGFRRRHHHGHTSNPRRDYCTADNQDWPCDTSRLLAAVEAVLKPHQPMKLYRSADGCDHPCPVALNGRGEYYHGKPEYTEWDEWNDGHPHGTTADGGMGDRICLLTEIGTACPACSALVYETWGDDDGFVNASDCIVRPFITAVLAGEETARGDGS